MKTISTQARVGGFTFPFISEIEVESSWQDLTDMATLKVPRKLSFQGKTIMKGESLFKKGDPVSIQAGYDGNLQTIFQGFITDIQAGVNLTFEVQDFMYLLKQHAITQTFRAASLQEVLATITNAPYQATDAKLGNLRFTSKTAAEILQYLKKEYGIYSFFRDQKLYTGLAYWPELSTDHAFRFQHNIISDDLMYQRADDENIRVIAISIRPDNSRMQVEVGDANGQTRTLLFYDVSESDLKKLAEENISQLKYEGYRGSITSFGEPFVQHGDRISISDPDYPDRQGTYLVKRVIYSLSTSSGYRQKVELGPLVS